MEGRDQRVLKSAVACHEEALRRLKLGDFKAAGALLRATGKYIEGLDGADVIPLRQGRG